MVDCAATTTQEKLYLAQHQTGSVLETEFRLYLSIMSNIGTAALMTMDPLDFWPRHAPRLPTFARIARKILPVGPTECRCEEVFSVSGRIYNDMRASLSRDHIDQLTCLYHWRRATLELVDPRSDKRQIEKL